MKLLSDAYPLTERRPCDACGGTDFEQIAHLRSSRIPDYSPPVSICRSCGFVTIRPRPPSESYRKINARWYPFKFDADPPGDPDENKKFRKWRAMWDRIEPYYTEGPDRVLDIGAGQGWAIEFLQRQRPDIEAVAIEQWQPSQEYMREKLGAEVVDVDINEDWPDSLEARFDLVIFRHTLEHLEEPLKALCQIHRCLSDEGAAYIVVPNGEARVKGRAVRTDFFRPVHLHYFNRNTLMRIADKAGLIPIMLDMTGEIWGLFRRKKAGEAPHPAALENSYHEQRKILMERLKEARWRDLKTDLRIQIRDIPRRLRSGAH